jgi:hypothetical protein
VRVIFGRSVDALLFDTGQSVQDFLTWFRNLTLVFGGLLQTRTTTLNGELRDVFCDWYPAMAQAVENLPLAV